MTQIPERECSHEDATPEDKGAYTRWTCPDCDWVKEIDKDTIPF